MVSWSRTRGGRCGSSKALSSSSTCSDSMAHLRWVTGASPGTQADHVAPRPSMVVPRPPSDPRRLTLAMGFCYTRPGFDSLVLEIRVRVDHDCRLLSARRLHRDVCTGRRL